MKNFINLKDITSKDLRKILLDAKRRKKKRAKLSTLDVDKDRPLKNKLLIQMFEKNSLRTRLSFYLAIKQLGGSALTLRPDEIHLKNGNEPLSDIAKIISSYADIFILRTDDEKKINLFKKNLKIPLVNGLSPDSHPAQIISDIFTIEEIKKKPISNLNICWVGDSNNVLNSLMEASVKFSFKLNIACPKDYSPNNNTLKWCKKNNSKIKIFHNAKKGVVNADVILTDKVISMNDKVKKSKKTKKFLNFKVNKSLIDFAKKDSIILHCLPRGKEISDEIFYSKNCKVWQQARNRACVQKSILLFCLNKLR